jgi:hypothetical protein
LPVPGPRPAHSASATSPSRRGQPQSREARLADATPPTAARPGLQSAKSRFMMILRMSRGRLPRAQPAGLVQRMADWRRQSALRAMARGHRPGFRTEIQEDSRQDQRPLVRRGFIRSGARSASVRKRLTRRAGANRAMRRERTLRRQVQRQYRNFLANNH